MIRYVKTVLAREEVIIHAASLHWVVYLRGAILVLLGAILGAKGGAFAEDITRGAKGIFSFAELVAGGGVRMMSVVVIIVGAFYLLGGYIRQISTELVVTNRRVIAKYGFVSVATFELMLPRVEGANIDQSVLGRILGYGTVLVRGTGGGISPIDHVSDPALFHSKLMHAIEAAREENNGDSRAGRF